MSQHKRQQKKGNQVKTRAENVALEPFEQNLVTMVEGRYLENEMLEFGVGATHETLLKLALIEKQFLIDLYQTPENN